MMREIVLHPTFSVLGLKGAPLAITLILFLQSSRLVSKRQGMASNYFADSILHYGKLPCACYKGVDRADIYSSALSPNVQWLAISSDKGIVHIFSLRVLVVGDDPSTALYRQGSSNSLDGLLSANTGANRCSSLSFLRGVLPKYFSSEWSVAQFHLPECTRFMTALGSQNTIIIVGMDGSFYRCSFDPVNGGPMVQQEHIRFLKTETRSK